MRRRASVSLPVIVSRRPHAVAVSHLRVLVAASWQFEVIALRKVRPNSANVQASFKSGGGIPGETAKGSSSESHLLSEGGGATEHSTLSSGNPGWLHFPPPSLLFLFCSNQCQRPRCFQRLSSLFHFPPHAGFFFFFPFLSIHAGSLGRNVPQGRLRSPFVLRSTDCVEQLR